MNNFRKAIALLLSLCMLASAALALAETADAMQAPADVATGEVTQAVAVTATDIKDTDVVAKLNGEDITWADVIPYYDSLVGYYGEPDASVLDTYRAFALETTIIMKLSAQTAAANGLDQYTQEELDAVNASADTDWQAALDNWVQTSGGLTDTSTEEEKTAAYKNAEAYFLTIGYDQAKLRSDYLARSTYDRVNTWVCKDITVTDDDVLASYMAKVANDQQIYENDLDAYETQIYLYNSQYADAMPMYHPAGYRYIKHILLPVDETLMSKYTDLSARLEEQMDTDSATAAPEATAAATDAAATDAATPEPSQEPVSQADVDNAKADILASVQAKTTEIYDKLAQGSDFDALIAEYGVKADGTATDPGMTSGSYPNGYEVATVSSSFVPEFVEAAFSVDQVGDVSAPYISDYGVHIVKYVADVPAGAVELTDTLKTSLRDSLTTEKNDAAMSAWQAAANVEYTGIVKSMAEIQAAADAASDTAADETAVDTTVDTATDAASTTEETVPEVTATPAA